MVGGGAGDAAQDADQLLANGFAALLAPEGGEGAQVFEGFLCRGAADEGEQLKGRDAARSGGLKEGTLGLNESDQCLRFCLRKRVVGVIECG